MRSPRTAEFGDTPELHLVLGPVSLLHVAGGCKKSRILDKQVADTLFHSPGSRLDSLHVFSRLS